MTENNRVFYESVVRSQIRARVKHAIWCLRRGYLVHAREWVEHASGASEAYNMLTEVGLECNASVARVQALITAEEKKG